MSWKNMYRSFYYQDTPEPEDITLPAHETALLVIDIQNKYMAMPEDPIEREKWTPFIDRMEKTVIPHTVSLIKTCREMAVEVIFARIACLKANGRDRSLSQKKPGWNYLLMPKDTHEAQLVTELTPKKDDIVVCKTTDSALTGTNLRLILTNMEIRHVIVAGIFTDQCVSSTVRSLADESLNVVVVEDCCAAGSHELHLKELEIINMIYCQVTSLAEVVSFLQR
jgi:nicotinamidase-related amidase